MRGSLDKSVSTFQEVIMNFFFAQFLFISEIIIFSGDCLFAYCITAKVYVYKLLLPACERIMGLSN